MWLIILVKGQQFIWLLNFLHHTWTTEQSSGDADLYNKVAQQGEKVRQLKTSKADKVCFYFNYKRFIKKYLFQT